MWKSKGGKSLLWIRNMTKKSRKGKVKHDKARHSRQPVATKATDQHQKPLPTVVKQAPVAKSLVTAAGLVDR
jgi:hypothetical protein